MHERYARFLLMRVRVSYLGGFERVFQMSAYSRHICEKIITCTRYVFNNCPIFFAYTL